MNENQQAAYINANVAAALIEMESMKAANWMREMQGHTIAYEEEAFLELIHKYGIGSNDVLGYFQLGR